MAHVTESRHDGGVALLAFDNSAHAGSIDAGIMAELHAKVRALLADDGVRAIVLTGTGRTFSTGADVRQLAQGSRDGSAPQWVLATTGELHPLLLELRASGKVFVAAVNGVAAGGGLGLALAADARIGGPDARFAAGYFGLGLSPDGGATWLLPRLVGEQRSRQFFFTNEVMPAEEAHFTGILDELVPAGQVVPRALEVARQWGAWSRWSRESTKRLLDAQSTSTLAGQLDLERGLIAAAAATPEFKEGVAAFLEKRKPGFP
ncbi:MAG TPA: enoyl-CoA hydratase/isomerase family protein [Candidatus Thermoplasmatota archaeon]|nr:enoyl-CoA hydratase/isomerase family protein [Candidatus Thermoplasmatota archaeon]